MRILRAICLLAALAASCLALRAQQEPDWHIEALHPGGEVEYDLATGLAIATNGVLVRYGTAVLTAERASVDRKGGEVEADGNVRLLYAGQVWLGEHIRYNFKTRQMRAEQFRTGKVPVFLDAHGLAGDTTNQVYYATNAFATTDDLSEPFQRIRARWVKIIPGDRIVAKDAVAYLGGVPVFYWPYYSRRLDVRANHFAFMPGYRSRYGGYLLNSYTWVVTEHLLTRLRLDYRSKRGVGGGADAEFDFGRWGEGEAQLYYLHDDRPEEDGLGKPYDPDRGIAWLGYQATPVTNLSLRARVRYQSDEGVLKEFYERLYRENPQPSTFFELNQLWQNFSLDFYAQPRVNDFLQTVERLPDVRLTGYRQQLGATPVYYESESSLAYLEQRYAATNVLENFAAFRGDTFHQLVLPRTFFGWLNFTPRAGGRFTYYSEASGGGAGTDEEFRGVFNTGAEVSLKATRLWPATRSALLHVNGLRHIIEPSVNYVYVPAPNVRPRALPQFDRAWPSLRLLPVEFPDYNAIDSIDSQNVIRWGLRNRLQTKRPDGVDTLAEWDVFTDWRLRPREEQTTFADLYSAFVFRPRSWITLESENRVDINGRRNLLAREALTLQPNSTWSLGFTYYYLRDDYRPDPTAWLVGSDVISTTVYYRLNENWGARASFYVDLASGRLAEQSYSLYRDFRSWTAALIFRVRDEEDDRDDDWSIGVTFSLKAFPRYGVGEDSVNRYGLLAY